MEAVSAMHCAHCGAESQPGKGFCADCGAPLARTCPQCGAATEAGKRFCADCGFPLTGSSTAPATPAGSAGTPAASTPAAPVAERRMCSVLFVDLVGFTSISANRDAEEVRELLSRYFEVASMVVGRYGGVIEKFIGDAVMAVWGTPVATEEDAERAVRAALDLVESVRVMGTDLGLPELAARAGVLTGEVAVTVGATNEGMVAGDAVNTAARIQSVATPGTVLVDGVTRRLSMEAIAYRDEGEFELKGKPAPERLWSAGRVLGNVGGVARIDGLEASLMGRGAELRSLREIFHAAMERRQPRLLLVSGVAGVGKSRLGWEFEKYADGVADILYWHRGRCSPYADGITFRAVAEAVRQRLGIAEEDPPELVGLHLREGLERYVPEAAREFVGVRLGRLLGVRYGTDTGGSMAQADLFAGWRQFFEWMADQHGVVLIIEDAHNAAPEMLAFIDHLVDWARDLPIFVLVLARPDIDRTQPGFGSGRNRIHIALDPLDDASMAAIVDELLPGAPANVTPMIVERAQGIPLYAIESIRALVDRDVVKAIDGHYRVVGDIDHLEVPDSLQSLLAARLDALDPLTRRVVTDVAVLGPSFPADAVQAVSELDPDTTSTVLEQLVRRAVLTVYADRLSPERGTYRFTQELLRQVAYESMSRRDRTAKHLKVAAHLRAAFPNDGEEVIDVVARHYIDALDTMPADDPATDSVRHAAIDALIRAAKRAARSSSHERALNAYRQAGEQLELAGQAVEAAEIWLEVANVTRLANSALSRAGMDLLDRARAIFAEHDDARGVARADLRLTRAYLRLGQVSHAKERALSALDVVRARNDDEHLYALRTVALTHALAGDYADALHRIDDAIQLAHELGVNDDMYAELLSSRGGISSMRGRRRDAELFLTEAARLARARGNPTTELEALVGLTDVLDVDRPHSAIEPGIRAVALAEQTGGPVAGSGALNNLVLAYLATGQWDDASAAAFDSQLARKHGTDDLLLLVQAFVAGLRGTAHPADWERSLRHVQDSEGPEDIASLAMSQAFLAYAAGDRQQALDAALNVLGQLDRLSFASDTGRWGWPLAARAAHELGRDDVERMLLGVVDAQPPGVPASVQRAEARLIRARLRSAAHEPEADADFLAAIDMHRDAASPYHLAHALIDHAEHLGPTDPIAAEHLAEAAAIATQLGCRPLQQRLAQLGKIATG